MIPPLSQTLVRAGRTPRVSRATWRNGIDTGNAPSMAIFRNWYSTATEHHHIDLRCTLPASLEIPTRASNQSRAIYLYNTGHAYLGFYKTGIKNVFSSYRDSRALRRTLQVRSGNATVSEKELAAQGLITRSEFQLLYRSRHDILRVPFFVVICTLTGELAPLVVLLLANQVPWTCRTPRQLEGKRLKEEDRRAKSALRLSASAPVESSDDDEMSLSREQLLHASTWLGTHSRHWNPPSFLLRRRLSKRRQYLKLDDQLLRKDYASGVSLDGENLRWALSDRGLMVSGKTEEEMRQSLQAYLNKREKHALYWLISRPFLLS